MPSPNEYKHLTQQRHSINQPQAPGVNKTTLTVWPTTPNTPTAPPLTREY